MNKKMKTMARNVYFAFAAQFISLLLSILMSLIVPKMLGIEEYGYWQLFLFYSNYVGFFLFGLNDGIYLRFGGKKYNEIDQSLIGSQFKITMIIQLIIALLIIIVSNVIIVDIDRRFILCFIALYMILFNAHGYLSYVLQAVNMTKKYSISIMIEKALFIISVIILLLLRVKYFETFVVFYVICKFISLLYVANSSKEILISSLSNVLYTCKEICVNIKVGINLMFANIASMLILGSGRLIIDDAWGVVTFGKLSFTLSLTNFFLMFISQFSMVLFPVLRQTSKTVLNKFYTIVRNVLGIGLPFIFLAYIPIKFIIGLWLPQYIESLKLLILLLPICTYDGKMNILCNTYFKVLRKEKLLLFLNIISMILSVILSLLGGYILHNMFFIIISMTVCIAFRCILSEVKLAKIMNTSVTKNICEEAVLVICFMIFTWYLPDLIAFLSYALMYLIFLIKNGNKVKTLYKQIKLKLKK